MALSPCQAVPGDVNEVPLAGFVLVNFASSHQLLKNTEMYMYCPWTVKNVSLLKIDMQCSRWGLNVMARHAVYYFEIQLPHDVNIPNLLKICEKAVQNTLFYFYFSQPDLGKTFLNDISPYTLNFAVYHPSKIQSRSALMLFRGKYESPTSYGVKQRCEGC